MHGHPSEVLSEENKPISSLARTRTNNQNLKNFAIFLKIFLKIVFEKGSDGVESTQKISNHVSFRKKAEKELSGHEIRIFLSEESGWKTNPFHCLLGHRQTTNI